MKKTYERGRTFFMDDVHLLKREGPLDFSTQKTLRTKVNTSVKVMKGVLFLFTKTYTAGARNTEEFLNPLISSVEVTIDAVPHSLYSDGIKADDIWENVLKKVKKVHKNFDEVDFRYHKYALWVDLRAAQENMLHGDGKHFGNSGDGLVINITLGSTETSVNCHIFVVSDVPVHVKDRRVNEYRK